MTSMKARPTTYNGIQMRSRLEAGFAVWLDQVQFEWEYEPRAFGSQRGQYLPDFSLKNVPCMWRPKPVTVYVEVKPWGKLRDTLEGDAEAALDDIEALMRRMAIIWESEPDAELMLATNSPEPTQRMMHLDISASPSMSDPFPWPCSTVIAYGPDLRPGFAHRLEHAPWTGRYWEFR